MNVIPDKFSPPLLRTNVRVIYTGSKRNIYDVPDSKQIEENICADSSEEWAEYRGHRGNQEASDSNLLDSAGNY